MKPTMGALVIGNSAYVTEKPLSNPVHDALDLSAKLKGYGFDVLTATDCTYQEMEYQLGEFRQLLYTHEVGLFFFAGHGVQIEGGNYLIAINTDMGGEGSAKHTSLALDRVVGDMAKSNARTKIIMLDACRNNPWQPAWYRSAASDDLASVYAPKGTIIGFATSPGEKSDGWARAQRRLYRRAAPAH